MDSETVNWLRTLRFLAEIDRMDPLQSSHPTHKVRQPAPLGERLLRTTTGLAAFRVQPEREKVRYRELLLEQLNARISLAKRRAIVEAAKKEEKQ